MSPGAYLARETAISAAINGLLSAGFCWLVFGGQAIVRVWGAGGLVVDYLPQGFMIGLMGALVPGLLVRRAVAAGRIDGYRPDDGRGGGVVRRALWTALAGSVLAATAAAGMFAVLGVETLRFETVLPIKVASGVLLALLVTPRAIRAVLD